MSVKKAMLGLIFSSLFIVNWQDNAYMFVVFCGGLSCIVRLVFSQLFHLLWIKTKGPE